MKTYQNEGDKEIKLHIADTTFELLRKTPIDEIRVDEIRKEASVGRTTFYRYFGSKRVIRDALLYSLEAHFEKEKERDPGKKTDDLFFSFLFENKSNILLLKKNGLMDVLDDLVLYVYVPDSEKEQEVKLVKYIASGLWMGFIRAILEDNFKKSEKEYRFEIAKGIQDLIAMNTPSKNKV